MQSKLDGKQISRVSSNTILAQAKKDVKAKVEGGRFTLKSLAMHVKPPLHFQDPLPDKEIDHLQKFEKRFFRKKMSVQMDQKSRYFNNLESHSKLKNALATETSMTASVSSSTLQQIIKRKEKTFESKRLPKQTIKTLNPYPSEKLLEGSQIQYSVNIDDHPQDGHHYNKSQSVSSQAKPVKTKDKFWEGLLTSPHQRKNPVSPFRHTELSRYTNHTPAAPKNQITSRFATHVAYKQNDDIIHLTGQTPTYNKQDRKFLKDEAMHMETYVTADSDLLPMSRKRITKMIQRIKNEQGVKVHKLFKDISFCDNNSPEVEFSARLLKALSNRKDQIVRDARNEQLM